MSWGQKQNDKSSHHSFTTDANGTYWYAGIFTIITFTLPENYMHGCFSVEIICFEKWRGFQELMLKGNNELQPEGSHKTKHWH